MKARIGRIEQALGLPAEAPPVQYSPALNKPRDHNLELYGFTQLDAIQDFKRVNPDWDATLRPREFRPQRASSAVTGSRSSAFASRGSAPRRPAYSRASPTRRSSSSTCSAPASMRARRRSACATCTRAGGRSWPARPTPCSWTATSSPTCIDYWGPTGMVFVRNPQIRWTFVDKDGLNAAVALEHPSDDIDSGQHPPDRRGRRREHPARTKKLPDLTAAVRYGGDWGHVRLAGILRKVGYETRARRATNPRAIRPAGASTRRRRSSSTRDAAAGRRLWPRASRPT